MKIRLILALIFSLPLFRLSLSFKVFSHAAFKPLFSFIVAPMATHRNVRTRHQAQALHAMALLYERPLGLHREALRLEKAAFTVYRLLLGTKHHLTVSGLKVAMRLVLTRFKKIFSCIAIFCLFPSWR